MSMNCRLCGKNPHQCGGWLERVNDKGKPGIWECRPSCDADMPRDVAVVGAIEGMTEPSATTEPSGGEG